MRQYVVNMRLMELIEIDGNKSTQVLNRNITALIL